MNPVAANPFLGIGMHAIGALCAATCYTPQKRVRGWSWQTYWITQAVFCWFLLPIIGAWLTIPELQKVLAEAPQSAMMNSFVLGVLYGVGGTAFGIAIRYIGFSLTYAIAVGLSGVLGTIIPPVVRGIYAEIRQHPGVTWGQYVHAGLNQLVDIAQKPGGRWVLAGIAIGTLGIGLCGLAGRSKEIDLQAQAASAGFNLTKGLLISLLAGVLSAVYGFSLEAGQPIADVAEKYGAGYWRGNVIYIFSNTGAFLTTAIYCIYLGIKHKSLGELVELPASEEQPSLPANFAMAVATGTLWYGQFFFYNLGHVRMGRFEFSSWAIHMTMLVLISNLVGIILREWTGTRPLTRLRLQLALLVLVAAVMLLTYGNRLAEVPPQTSPASNKA